MPSFGPSLFLSFSLALGSLSTFGMLVATAIVVGRLRRRYGPKRGADLLFGWSVAALVWGFVYYALFSATPYVVSRLDGGWERMQELQAATRLFATIVHTGLGIAFLVGLTRVMRDEQAGAPPRRP